MTGDKIFFLGTTILKYFQYKKNFSFIVPELAIFFERVQCFGINNFRSVVGYSILSCRTATLDFFFDLAESKVAVFLCSILTNDGVPFCFGKNLFP